MRIKTTIAALLAWSASMLAQNAVPVGVILSASGDAKMKRGTTASWVEAAPGSELRPGDSIRTGMGTVRFVYCPERTAQTLAAGQLLTVPPLHLARGASQYSEFRNTGFCDLPSAPARQLQGRDGMDTRPRPGGVDILSAIEQASARERSGDLAGAAEEYRRIADDYPAAKWARGTVVPHGPLPFLKGTTFALLIGISKYPPESPLPDLAFADADAEAFARFLRTPKGGNIPLNQIRLLLNGAATRDAIDSAVRDFEGYCSVANPCDNKQNTLILFIAGHGHLLDPSDMKNKNPADGDPYVMTADVYRQDIGFTGYPMADLRTLVAEETRLFGRVMVYLDVCHAGYTSQATKDKDFLQPAVREVFSARKGNVGLLMAAGPKEFAFEAQEWKHGAFTYSVLDGLNGGAARANNTVITFSNLFDFVRAEVQTLTQDAQVPEGFVNDNRMPVLDDVTKTPGLPLQKAKPIAISSGARRRGLPASGGNSEAVGKEFAPTPFELLAKKDPLAALAEYGRLMAGATTLEATKDSLTETLRVSLEEHGQRIIIRYLHGEQIAQRKEDFELCERYFHEALRLPSPPLFDEARMWFCKGRALIFDGEESRHQEAVRMLEQSILLDPDHAYAYNALGIAYLQQVRLHVEYYARATAAFRDAQRFAPDWAYPTHNLALTSAEQGDFAAAAEYYRRAIAQAPSYSYLPYNLGLLNQRMNRRADAERFYNEALKKANDARDSGLVPRVAPWSERANIRNALGTLAVEKRDYKKAEMHYEEALSDDPGLSAAKYNLAALLSRKGPSTRALALLRENIQAAPNASASRLALAKYLAKYSPDPNDGIREYENTVRVAPDHTDARRQLAKLYAMAKRWQDAYDQLREARAQMPEYAAVAEELGDAALSLGRTDEARTAYRDAATLYRVKQDRARVSAKQSRLESK